MKRHVQPESPGEKPKRKKATIDSSHIGTRVRIHDVAEDDPSIPTQEGNVRLFLDQALRRFNEAVDAEVYNRTEGLTDVLMVDGEGQWDMDVRGRRERKKRPCLTINRLKPMIAHVTNEQRMSRPAIQIDPVGNGADPVSAAIRQGLIRHIEIQSNAETIYDTVFERMVEKGWSWFRIVTDWEDELSFNQVVRIEGFLNDFAIYVDPNAEDPTRKDMKWAFIAHDIPRGQYVTQYPKSQIASITNFTSIGDQAEGWVSEETIRVVEYYYLDEEEVNIIKLTNGAGIWEDEIEERAGLWWSKKELQAYDEDRLAAEDLTEIPVEKDERGNFVTRKSYRTKVKWAKINAVEILDGDMASDSAVNTAGRVIPGRYIPLVMAIGQERVVRGKRRLAGMVRNARDAQRMYNYAISAFVEMIALSPKSPFVAAFGQIEKYKPIWDSANLENYVYLPYDPVSVNGQPLPPPQRQNIEPPIGALIQAIREFDNDLKILFNIYDPTLGAPGAEQSGRAVAGLQARSEAANMNWQDNMRRAEIHGGEIILDMIPAVYDAARIITIVRPDNQSEEIQINQEFARQDGQVVNYDMARGRYAVTVALGEYASKRQAAVQSLMKIAEGVPQVAMPLLPLILDNMDTPMAKEAGEIVQRMLGPELQKPGSPAEMQAQLKMFTQQHEMLVDALEKANRVIETKLIDAETKKEVETIRQRAAIAIAAAKLGSAEGIARLNAEYKAIGDDAERLHDRLEGELARQHEKDIEAMQPAGAPA